MTWYGTDVIDLGNEVPGLIDLAFNPLEPRDSHGRWTKSGTAATVDAIKSASGKTSDWEHYTHAMRPVPYAQQQRATRDKLLASAQKRILEALNTPPEQMSDQQVSTALRVITHLTPHDYEQVRRATHEVVPVHIAKHVTNKVASLAKGIMHEQNDVARKKLITHLAVILGALAVSFISASLGVPAGLAALIGIFPYLSQEYRDYKTEKKDVPLIAPVS